MNHIGQHTPGGQWHVKLRHSMQTKFMLAFILVFLTTFLGTGFIAINGLPFGSFQGWEASAKQEAVRSLDLIADLRKERLMNWFRERQADVQVIAGNPIITAYLGDLISSIDDAAPIDGNGDSPRAQIHNRQAVKSVVSFLSAFRNAYTQNRAVEYQVIRIVDANTGRVLASTHADEIGLVLSDHDKSMDVVVRAERRYISDVVMEDTNSPAHFDIGHPVFDSTGAVIASVVMEVTLESALNMYLNDDGGLGETGEALLVNEDGYILTPLRYRLPDGSRARVLQVKITAKPERYAASGREGIVESEDYRGHEVIAAYRHIRISPDWGWGLVVKVDKNQLFAFIDEGIGDSIWISLAGIVLITILSLVLTFQLTQPLSRITAVARRLAAGERFERTQVESRDEIGVLSAVFDEMIEKLDSTNRRLLRRSTELDAVNKELESFAYAVAHDLRAPLRAIDGFSQALVEDYGEQLDVEAKNYLRYLREGSQEMGCLIDDLLKLSRATRGDMSFEDVNLSKIATEVVGELRLTDPERKVETNIDQGIVVSGDPRLLRIMMDNLLGNAWKFTARSSQACVGFTARRINGQFCCVVQDNGVGFDMAYKDKLFLPFQRLHRSEEFEGTGIGLVTVQRIIHRHGGTLLAEGIVDKGASFTFELNAGGKDHG